MEHTYILSPGEHITNIEAGMYNEPSMSFQTLT